MIYFVGGAPRAGKSILTQQVATRLKIGWISTDLLVELLRAAGVEGIKTQWDATPEAIIRDAEWFFPLLGRFVQGVSSLAENYVIEGVDFLPSQIAQLAENHAVRAVFLGCSEMTLERFDQFPGKSKGYAGLPEELRRQIAHDVPLWSEFIREQAERFGYPYVDMADDFLASLQEAEGILIENSL